MPDARVVREAMLSDNGVLAVIWCYQALSNFVDGDVTYIYYYRTSRWNEGDVYTQVWICLIFINFGSQVVTSYRYGVYDNIREIDLERTRYGFD